MKVKTIEDKTLVKQPEFNADAVYITNDQGDKLRVTTRQNGEFIINIPAGYAITPGPGSIDLVKYMD
jgi:hypothetical protein